MAEYYEWFKAFHIISVIFWMAGLLYLPRIFVYHSQVEKGSEADKLFQIMERRLLRGIMNPSMIFVYIFGGALAYIYGFVALGLWFHLKFLFVLGLTIFHAYLSICRKRFLTGQNVKSTKFFRLINEIPAIFAIFIVLLVILKPFN